MATSLPGQVAYNFGNPNGEEQLYIELINRARANPAAEGARHAASTDPGVLGAYAQFVVDLAMMQNEFNAILAQPPLAPNASLTTAARSHSDWMLANNLQTHDETNPSSTATQRIVAAGYTPRAASSENVYAYATGVGFGHVGLQVDWGYEGTGGMLPGRGHRVSIHSGTYREIGVGVTLGSYSGLGGVGPQLVTQDFGLRTSSPSFGTGVAYYDLNDNDFYDFGEGIPGIRVDVEGVSDYCITADGGGWAVPVPSSAATRMVTFSGVDVDQTGSLVFPASKNVKADLQLAYSPPAITSRATAYTGMAHTMAFTASAGATDGYTWRRSGLTAAAKETCEATTNITWSTTGDYSVRNTSIKKAGSSSFHLENTTHDDQFIELNGLYHGLASASLSFQSRIRYATTNEFFKVQVKELGGSEWKDVFSQAGTGEIGEGSFTLRNAPLTSMTGKTFRIRFLLDYTYGGSLPASPWNLGWFIDEITFTNVSTLTNTVTQLLPGTTGTFTPAVGSYLMSVTPENPVSGYPAAYQTLTVSAPPAPSYALWAATAESANLLPAGTLSDAYGDGDQDGRNNLIEYAFGTSPVSGNDPAVNLPALSATETHLILQYRRNTALSDLTFIPQACAGLDDWKATGEPGAPAGFTDSLISTLGGIQTREAKIPNSTGSGFLRMQVRKP